MRKRWSIILCGILLMMAMAGCGSSTSTADTGAAMETVNSYSTEDMAVTESEAGIASGNGENVNLQDQNRKLIKTENITAQTKDLDKLLETLKAKVAELNGYMENTQIYSGKGEYQNNRNANMTIRIPEENLEVFLNEIKGNATVVDESENVEDVTLNYVDVQSHIAALETERDSLMKMMEQAENLEDIIAIQAQLTEVRYQLDSYESQLRVYDNQIQYSTVYLYINEVNREMTVDTSFGSQLKEKFISNLYAIKNGFLAVVLWFLSSLPILVIVAVCIVVFVVVIKKIFKSNRNKKDRDVK